MSDKLSVYIDSELIGELWLDHRKLFCFQYSYEWLTASQCPLSLSLPLRDEPYLQDESHSFFANLLPEGHIREVIARRLGLSKDNNYSILEKIGGDCAGAVSVLPCGKALDRTDSGYVEKTDQELKLIISELPRRPFLAGEIGFRLSLAGAQKKLPVAYSNGHFYLPIGNAPSTHIIKPPIGDLDGSVENEAFCMNLAARIGLLVPPSFVYQIDDTKIFVIERYDRVVTEQEVRRIHQEDFCQSLNILPNYKYEAEGGPSLYDYANLIRSNSPQGAKDISFLVKWCVYNELRVYAARSRRICWC